MPEKKIKVFDHFLVPRHILLSSEEAEKLLERFNIKPFQLPKITTSDPVVKAIKAKVGDIVKVVRKSPTSGEAVAYRYVVEAS